MTDTAHAIRSATATEWDSVTPRDPSPLHPGSVADQLRRLDASLDELGKVVDLLRGDLGPILGPDRVNDLVEAVATPSPSCEIAAVLAEHTTRVEQVTDRLQSVRRSIGL